MELIMSLNDNWVSLYAINSSISQNSSRVEKAVNSLGTTFYNSTLEVSNALYLQNEQMRDVNNHVANIYKGVDISNKLLSTISDDLKTSIRKLGNIEDLLSNIYEAISTPRSTESQELSRLARKNFETSMLLKGDRAKDLIESAIDLYTQSIEIHPQNYVAQFDLGWIQYNINENTELAQHHFSKAISASIVSNREFAILAIRNLGQLLSRDNCLEEALSITNEGIDLLRIEGIFDSELVYESILLNHKFGFTEVAMDWAVRLYQCNKSYELRIKGVSVFSEDEINSIFMKASNEEKKNIEARKTNALKAISGTYGNSGAILQKCISYHNEQLSETRTYSKFMNKVGIFYQDIDKIVSFEYEMHDQKESLISKIESFKRMGEYFSDEIEEQTEKIKAS